MMGNVTIDVIGVILDVQETSAIIVRSTGESRDKRTLTIGDESNVSIGVTLWGTVCQAHDYNVGQIVALKACRVSEYNGRSLNASSDVEDVFFSPKHPRTLELQKITQKKSTQTLRSEMRSLGGDPGMSNSRTPTLLIQELTQFCEQDSEVLSGKPFYANLMCDIGYVFTPKDLDRKMYYLACPKCKKKVFDNSQGYQCESC